MRLICPNCDAQYEVVDDVIPAEGRDVQCSNCGQTWYQHHPDHMPEAPEVDTALPSDLDEPDDTPGEDEERTVADVPTPEPRRIEPEVADILREEAERETRARTAEADGLEVQPDLGLDSGESEADMRARQARERMARMRGEETLANADPESFEAAAAAAAIGSRSELLPDIEEINSTLRPASDRQATGNANFDADETEAPRKRSGFGRGFFLIVLLAIILILIYVFAPQIAQALPPVDPALNTYVAQVDAARMWLDSQLTNLLTWLDAAAGATPPASE